MQARPMTWGLAIVVVMPFVATPVASGLAVEGSGGTGAPAEGQSSRTSRALSAGCEVTNASASMTEIQCTRADDFVWGFQLSCGAGGHEIEYFAGSGAVAAIDFHDEPLAFRMVSSSGRVSVTERDIVRIMQTRMVFVLPGSERVFEATEDEHALLQRCLTRPAADGTPPPDRVAPSRDTASSSAVATFRDCPHCPEMVALPSGAFRMGSTEGQPDERPVHEVRIPAFALGRFEVTLSQYEAFVVATNYRGAGCSVVEGNASLVWSTEASWRRPGFAQEDRHPVVCVSWDDAQAYVQWLATETGERYRLPTEAEWEYGARSNAQARRYWDTRSDTQCNHANGGDRALANQASDWPTPIVDCNDGVVHTAPVGTYSPNLFGLYDTLGNVWEWTADCYHDDYRGAPVDGTAWILHGDCEHRVLRGGSWETSPNGITVTNRFMENRRTATSLWGFRVAREVR